MCSTGEVGVEAVVTAADTALTHALTAGLTRGIEQLTHDQAAQLLSRLRAVAGKVDALTLAVVGKVDADGTFALDGALSTGAWVRERLHQSPAEAARTVRTARTLRSGMLPNTQAALAAGAISGRQAAVIADGVKDAPAGSVPLIEPEAVATAADGDVRAVANVMRAFAHALDPDAADQRAVRRYERAGVTFAPLLGGGFAISGTMDEATGAAIVAAVDHASPLVSGDTRSPARRRLDGLHAICRRWLATAPTHPDSTGTTVKRTARSRAQLIVTIDEAGLRGQPGSPGGTVTWAGPITAATAARLGCDAMASYVTLDPDGNVIDVRRERRFFTRTQILAIIARDGDTCPTPYCDRPSVWSDAHHLIPREHGGPTTIANGALPCEGHHLLLHEGHWTLQRLPDGRYLLRHRDTGKVIGPEPHRPGHNRPPPDPPPEAPPPAQQN